MRARARAFGCLFVFWARFRRALFWHERASPSSFTCLRGRPLSLRCVLFRRWRVCARAHFSLALSLSLSSSCVCLCLFGVVVLCWSSSFALFCITISLLLFSFIAGGLVGMVWRARSEAPLMIIGTGMKQREDTTTTRAQGLLFFKACSQRARGLFARVRRRVVFFLPPRALTTKTKEQSRRQKRACAPTFFDTAREKSDRAIAHDERADSLQRLRHIYLPHEKGTTTDRGGDGPAPSFAPKKKERTTMKRE